MTYSNIIMWVKVSTVVVYPAFAWLVFSLDSSSALFVLVAALQTIDCMYTNLELEYNTEFDAEFFDITKEMESADHVGVSIIMGMCPILWIVVPVMIFISKLKNLEK